MNLVIFLVSAAAIAFLGTKLVYVADRLADRTGFGEALIGAVLLGATTSISGSVLSVISAYDGLVDLAIGNAVGGIAAQTFFLVLADIFYRRSNLEHAAVSSTNLMLTTLLIALLSLVILLTTVFPSFTVWSVHPGTFLLFALYLGGLKYVSKEKKEPMWQPKVTKETMEDIPGEPKGGKQLTALSIKFSVLAIFMVIAGIAVKESGVRLANSWGLTQLALGTVFTAITTSLPELITTFKAVQRGALTLAVGGIVGGNTFDVLFIAFSDIAYRDGSIYSAITTSHIANIAITIVMNTALLMGLIRRERHGVANIGIESFAMAILYFISLILLFN